MPASQLAQNQTDWSSYIRPNKTGKSVNPSNLVVEQFSLFSVSFSCFNSCKSFFLLCQQPFRVLSVPFVKGLKVNLLYYPVFPFTFNKGHNRALLTAHCPDVPHRWHTRQVRGKEEQFENTVWLGSARLSLCLHASAKCIFRETLSLRLPGIRRQTHPPEQIAHTDAHSKKKKPTVISHSLYLSISKSSPSPQLLNLPVYNSGDKSPLGRTHKEKTNGEGREGRWGRKEIDGTLVYMYARL